MTLSVYATMERWPLKEPFSIARYTFVESLVVTIRVRDSEGYEGVGECEPHEWDEQASLGMLKSAGLEPDKWLEPQWATRRIDRERLIQELPRSPIRNAIDCALWDLACKREGKRASHFADTEWSPLTVIPTIGIDTPEKMETIARSFGPVSMIKVKLGASDGLDADRMEAVSHAMPGVPLLIDVNTGWSPEMLTSMLPVARRCNVRIIEQPMLPEMDEHMLAPVNDMLYCADESCLDRASLPRIQPYFQYINIKLDKTGGLTEASALRKEAERLGMGVMVGMMSGTSLAVAPASLLAQGLEVVDLELGFLKQDRDPAMKIDSDQLLPPKSSLWG